MLERIIERLIEEVELSPAQAEQAAMLLLDMIEDGTYEIERELEVYTSDTTDEEEDWEAQLELI